METKEQKAARFIKENRVLLEGESDRFRYFKVNSELDTYSVMYDKSCDLWTCTCLHKTYSVKGQEQCSHILACDLVMYVTR